MSSYNIGGVARKTPFATYGTQTPKRMNYGVRPLSPITGADGYGVVDHIARYSDPLSTGSTGGGGAAGVLGAPGPTSTGRFSVAAGGAPAVNPSLLVDNSKKAQDQAAATVTPPDYTADPALQKVRAISATDSADARAQAIARRKQLAVDFGDETFARGIGADELTVQAARENPYSVIALLDKQQKQRTGELEDSLNKANLFYSGYRGKALGDVGNAFVQAQAEAQGRARGQLGDIEGALIDAERAAQQQQIDAESTAWRDELIWQLTHPSVTPPATDTPADPTVPPAPPPDGSGLTVGSAEWRRWMAQVHPELGLGGF